MGSCLGWAEDEWRAGKLSSCLYEEREQEKKKMEIKKVVLFLYIFHLHVYVLHSDDILLENMGCFFN